MAEVAIARNRVAPGKRRPDVGPDPRFCQSLSAMSRPPPRRWSPRMADIGVDSPQSGFGHLSLDCITVPATRVAASVSRLTPERMSMEKHFSSGMGCQECDRPGLLTDDPTRCERHAPAALGARDLRAVQEGVRAPTNIVVLDPPFRNLAINRVEDVNLRLPHALGDVFPAPYDVECTPSEQGRHGVEVGAIRLASEPCCLEWNAASSAERIAHPRHAAESSLTQLLYQAQAG